MRTSIPIHVLGLFVLVICVSACGGVIRFGELDPPDPEEKVVVDVNVEGSDEVSESEIIDGLANHSLFWASEAPLLDTRELATDRERIEAFYASKGFFAARVLDVEIEDRTVNTVEITFIVEEGPATTVVERNFVGLDQGEITGEEEEPSRLRDTHDSLESLSSIEVGDRWTESAHNATKDSIQKALRDDGFIFAEVLGEVVVDRQTHEATVTYRISHGPLVRIRNVTVKKNETAADQRIMDRAGLKAGAIVENNDLRRAEQDVYDLGFFFYVSAQPQRPSVEEKLGDVEVTYERLEQVQWPDEVDVHLVVNEMPVHELRAGVGARIDNESSDAHVSLGYLVRYFLGNIRQLDFRLDPAWYFIPSFFDPQIDGPGGTARASYREPSVFEEKLDLTVPAQYRLTVETAYRQHQVGVTPQLSRRFLRFIQAFVAYGLEYNEYFSVTDGFISEINLPELNLAARGKYLLSFLRQGITLDLRDDARRTTEGFYTSFVIEESFEGLGSSFDFIKGWIDVRGYVSAGDVVTFALRFKWGQIFTLFGSRVPLSARFRSGGPTSMRGFGAGRMGPKLCLPDESEVTLADDVESCPAGTSANEEIYIGGNIIGEASFESRFAIGESFGIVAFVDVGELWNELDDITLKELNVAVGPGLRYYTPFGPIRLDFAFLLTSPSPPDFQFHFSIGQTF